MPDHKLIATHARNARGLLAQLRLELDELLVPVWPPLAAPTVSREGQHDLLRYDLRLLDWLVRVECAATAYPSDAPVLLTAQVRPQGPLARAGATLANPMDAGWTIVLHAPIRSVTRDAVEDVLYQLRAALWSRPDIRRRVSRQAA